MGGELELLEAPDKFILPASKLAAGRMCTHFNRREVVVNGVNRGGPDDDCLLERLNEAEVLNV